MLPFPNADRWVSLLSLSLPIFVFHSTGTSYHILLRTEQCIFCQLVHVQFIRSFQRRPHPISLSSFYHLYTGALETSESLPNDDLIFLDCINCLFTLFARLVLIFFLNISTILCACECLWLFYRFSISNKNPISYTEK